MHPFKRIAIMLGETSTTETKKSTLKDTINARLVQLVNKNSIQQSTNTAEKRSPKTKLTNLKKMRTLKNSHMREIEQLKKQVSKLMMENKKLKSKPNNDNALTEPRASDNYYASLMDFNDEPIVTAADGNREETDNVLLQAGIQELAKKTKEKNIMTKKITDKVTPNVQQSSNGDQPTKNKMPPINFFKTDIKLLRALFTKTLKSKDFLIKQINDNNNILYTHNLSDFKKAREILDKAEITYYTYTPKEEKKTTLVLRGLSSSYSCDEVLDALKQLNNEIIKFEKVTRLTTKYSISQNRVLPLFIVQAAPHSPVNEIQKIKVIDHQIIRWERIHKPEIMQCTRCQRFGHSSSNCKMQSRCVKCGDNHLPAQCKITPDDPREKLYCILCKEYGHPASFKECTKYLELAKKRAEVKELMNRKIENKYIATNFTQPNISFAKVVSSNCSSINSNSRSNKNSISNNNSISNSINNNDILIEIRNSIISMQKKMDTYEQKLDNYEKKIDKYEKKIENVEKIMNTNTENIRILFDHMRIESNQHHD